MADISGASEALRQLKDAVNKNDLNKATQLVTQLKIKLTTFTALPPVYNQTPTAQQELLLARETYELAVSLSVKKHDEEAFQRNFLQLKTYYTDTRSILPPSPSEHPILGLNLLRLLVQNRTAEFHTELELLPAEVQASPCIKHAIELEQALMEGAYSRVLAARQHMPDPSYAFFMDLLVQTVRDEIASCSEKAYDSLTLPDIKRLLMFSSDVELKQYVEQHEWEIRNNVVFFQKEKEREPRKDIPSEQIMQHAIFYARELERIV